MFLESSAWTPWHPVLLELMLNRSPLQVFVYCFLQIGFLKLVEFLVFPLEISVSFQKSDLKKFMMFWHLKCIFL